MFSERGFAVTSSWRIPHGNSLTDGLALQNYYGKQRFGGTGSVAAPHRIGRLLLQRRYLEVIITRQHS